MRAISHVATRGAKPPKIVTAVLKLKETPIARTSTGNSSERSEGRTPLYPALRRVSQAAARSVAQAASERARPVGLRVKARTAKISGARTSALPRPPARLGRTAGSNVWLLEKF